MVIFGISNVCLIALWITAAQRYRQLMALYKQGNNELFKFIKA